MKKTFFRSSPDIKHMKGKTVEPSPCVAGVPRYAARSNREEGAGQPDIVLYPNQPKDPAILFEIKIRKKFNEMQDGIEEAFRQIRERKYAEGILDDGYIGSVAYGVCFCKKSCIVQKYR